VAERRGGPAHRTVALLCDDVTVSCEVLASTVVSAGLEVVDELRSWPALVERVAEGDVDAVIVDLAMTGTVGARLVQVLRAAAPWCEVIVVAPIAELDLTALEAGVAAVVFPTDLRPLSSVLTKLAHRRASR
jgi:CheY-like chemotaxis protein